MAGMEALFQGLQMFNQGLQQYSTSRAIGQATDAVKQLNESEVSAQEKRVGQIQLGNQLAAHLAQLGAPASQIQAATGAIKPEQFSSPQEMMMQGMLTGNKELQTQGEQFASKLAAPGIAAEGRKFNRDVYLKKMELDAHLRGAVLKAGAKGGKELSDAHIDKISALETTPAKLDSLLERLDTEGVGVGPVSGNNPVRSFMPDTAAFDADLGRLVAEYRKSVTGAGMSDEERKELNRNFPKATDTADVFKAKAEKLKYFAGLEKAYTLKNLARGGRDISSFVSQQPQQQRQADTQEKVIGNTVYKRVNGGWVPK